MRRLIPVLGIAAALVSAGTAMGAVTVGSTLGSPANESSGCSLLPCTITNSALVPSLAAPGGLASPVSGTVTGWSFKAQAGGYTLSLRILRPLGGDAYTGVGTSAPATSAGGVQGPIAASLPIQAGDHIGLNASAGSFVLCDCGQPNQALSWTSPTLADGDARSGSPVFGRELLVQALVEPTNTVTFGKVKRNKKKGTATVEVNVPNAGQLAYGGSRAKIGGPASVAGPGEIRLTVRAKGASKTKLNDAGKVKVAVDVTFTPINGVAATSPIKVKLLKKA